MSQPLLRILAYIAIWQPIPLEDLAGWFGQPASRLVDILVERDLIHCDQPARGYETTNTFLERFGLASLGELPSTLAEAVSFLAMVEARTYGKPSPELEERRQTDPTYQEEYQAALERLEFGVARSRYDIE